MNTSQVTDGRAWDGDDLFQRTGAEVCWWSQGGQRTPEAAQEDQGEQDHIRIPEGTLSQARPLYDSEVQHGPLPPSQGTSII